MGCAQDQPSRYQGLNGVSYSLPSSSRKSPRQTASLASPSFAKSAADATSTSSSHPSAISMQVTSDGIRTIPDGFVNPVYLNSPRAASATAAIDNAQALVHSDVSIRGSTAGPQASTVGKAHRANTAFGFSDGHPSARKRPAEFATMPGRLSGATRFHLPLHAIESTDGYIQL